jgi:hypothetical protein
MIARDHLSYFEEGSSVGGYVGESIVGPSMCRVWDKRMDHHGDV